MTEKRRGAGTDVYIRSERGGNKVRLVDNRGADITDYQGLKTTLQKQEEEIVGKFLLSDAEGELLPLNETIIALTTAVKGLLTTTIVSCPLKPVGIAGIGAGAEDANDAMGLLTRVAVPKRGVLISGTYFDLDDEGSQVDLEIFNEKPTQIADNAAWTCSDVDVVNLIHELSFVSFDDHITQSQTSEVTSINKAYTAPGGFFWIQAVCRAICTIAVAPRFQIQIQSFDPDFKES